MILGARQKAWFLDQLRNASARWKLWGNSFGTLDWRTDFQNLPVELRDRWPSNGYAALSGDWSGYRAARAEIFDFVRRERITGFGTVVGDRHSFVAGLLSADLPPRSFEPVGVEFITGSISAPGLAEAAEYAIKKDHPLRALYLFDPPNGEHPHCAVNVSLMHGVNASFALQKTGDVNAAMAARNAEVAPHLSFCDVGGHGYALVRASAEDLRVEFVCIPRPIERSESADGGPVRYRVLHRVAPWQPGETPRLERSTLEGTPPIGV
jgi:alkaline phosphatase D